MTPVIFFDLDGVLANFVKGALGVHKATLAPSEVKWDFCSQIGFQGTNDPGFWEPMGFDFWATLDPLLDGFALLAAAEVLVGPENIGLLSSPLENVGAVEGKRAWVKEHLPQYSRRAFFGSEKRLIAAPGKILVDDHDVNVDAWRKTGSPACIVPRPWNRYWAFCDKETGRFYHDPVQETLAAAVDIVKYRTSEDVQ